MATQLQVAYSATFDGAGIIAAGPYDCGQGNVIDFATCDIGASLPTLEQQAVTWSHEGLIDRSLTWRASRSTSTTALSTR